MIKRTINYFDLDGNDLTEDFYFNLSKSELSKMDLKIEGGLASLLRGLDAQKNPAQIVEVFEMLISKSVGMRSVDGKRIVKTPEFTNSFIVSDPYDKLFEELLTDTAKAIEFIVGIFPKEMQGEMLKHQADALDKASKGQITINIPEGASNGFPEEKPFLERSLEELLATPKEQFDREFAQAKHPVPKHVLQAAMQRRDQEETIPKAS